MKHFIDGEVIAFDTETTGLEVWHKDKPFAFSFTNENLDSVCYEFDVNPFTREPVVNPHVMNRIQALLEDDRITKIGHNIKFDVRMMERGYGVKVRGKLHDTMIMAFCCNTLEPSLGLKQLGKKYADVPTDDQVSLKKIVNSARRKGAKAGWKISYAWAEQPHGPPKRKAQTAADYWIPGTMARRYPKLLGDRKGFVTPEILETYRNVCRTYAIKDTERTILLRALYEELMDELEVRHVYEDIEMPLWPVIYAMETRGPCTDVKVLEQQMKECVKVMDELYPKLERAAWKGFQPTKSKDLQKLFYEKLGFPIIKMTSGGKYGNNKQPATDKWVILDHLDNPIVRMVAIWKANHTAFATFYSKYKRLSIPDTFGGGTALHCDYRQVGGDQAGTRGGVATGRLSSQTPNLQNVTTPENTSAVHPLHCRPAFIPRPGHVWLCIDYEGMEIRMFAAVSNEPTMMKAIREGRKIHDEMTNVVWGGPNNEAGLRQASRSLSLDGTGIPSEEVLKLWREWGVTPKNVNSLSQKRQYEFTDSWLKRFNYDVVVAEESIHRKNMKTAIKTLSFLKIYGGGAEKATLVLKCSVWEARDILKLYDRRFPRVTEYSRELIAEAKANGYIRSQWGRRLEINKELAYRCVNYMIQGSSADLMKVSLVRMHNWLREEALPAHVLLTIHDEIIMEVPWAYLTKPFIRTACSKMSDTEGVLPIDMAVEPKVVTQNWSIKQKVKYLCQTSTTSNA